jgi:hypothetical protein
MRVVFLALCGVPFARFGVPLVLAGQVAANLRAVRTCREPARRGGAEPVPPWSCVGWLPEWSQPSLPWRSWWSRCWGAVGRVLRGWSWSGCRALRDVTASRGLSARGRRFLSPRRSARYLSRDYPPLIFRGSPIACPFCGFGCRVVEVVHDSGQQGRADELWRRDAWARQ